MQLVLPYEEEAHWCIAQPRHSVLLHPVSGQPGADSTRASQTGMAAYPNTGVTGVQAGISKLDLIHSAQGAVAGAHQISLLPGASTGHFGYITCMPWVAIIPSFCSVDRPLRAPQPNSHLKLFPGDGGDGSRLVWHHPKLALDLLTGVSLLCSATLP